ncbi:MAG: hypothetical protein ACLF0G_05220 [Candidatus Brocadiia bacterium]
MKARHNPFRAQRLDALRFRPQGTTWPRLMDRLAALGMRGAVVGPDGSGKTALLEALAPRLEARGFRVHRVGLDRQDRWPWRKVRRQLPRRLDRGDAVLLDGADLLPRLGWRALERRTRRAGGLVVAAHRPGLLPTLLECTTSPELLAELVAELAPADAPSLRPTVDRLYRQHGGNLRAALRGLYDLYAAK